MDRAGPSTLFQSLSHDYSRSYACGFAGCVHHVLMFDLSHLCSGLVKSHFYHIWVQLRVLRQTKEIRELHGILSKMQIPTYLGRLPALMGSTAGGSLTANQWLIAAIAVLPVAIPQIWRNTIQNDHDANTVLSARLDMFKKARESKKAKAAKAKKTKQADKQGQSSSVRYRCVADLLVRPPGAPVGTRTSSWVSTPPPSALVCSQFCIAAQSNFHTVG
jgi:hypothetical protein